MPPAPAGSLLLALRQVPDPRGRQGCRHPFAAMLAAVVCAMLCGARSYSAIVQWVHAHQELWHPLGFTRRPPKLGAFRTLLMRVSTQQLEEVLNGWVSHVLGSQPTNDQVLQAVAMDGKSLCGTFSEYGRAIHLLSLLDQATGFILSQQEVDGKTNEHKTALALLKGIVLHGRVITGDAMFCQRDVCQQIVADGGHYFFEVKDNQPELKKAIEAEFQPAFSPLHGTSAAG